MKIRNYLTIFLATVAIILLLALAGYLTYQNTDDANPVKQQITDMLPDFLFSDQNVQKETETEPASVSESEMAQTNASVASAAPHSFIFVGDSRTVSMGKALQDGCTYIGKDGEGYAWFSSDGVTELTAALENDPTIPVIFNLGVNDPEDADLYTALYQSLASQYSDTPFFYLSVNPLSDDSDFNTTNDMIQQFNQTIQQAFSEHYINGYDYLMEHGFETVDGLHYTEDTSKVIHDYVVDQVNSKLA